MAGGDSPEEKLTGLSKHFNSVTDRGRANVSNLKVCPLMRSYLIWWANIFKPMSQFRVS